MLETYQSSGLEAALSDITAASRAVIADVDPVIGQFGVTRFATDNGGKTDNVDSVSSAIDAVANQFVAMTGGQVTALGGYGETFHEDQSGFHIVRPAVMNSAAMVTLPAESW